MSPDVLAYVLASLRADGLTDEADEVLRLNADPAALSRTLGEPPARTMADDPGPEPVVLPTRGQSSSSETALAGRDGAALARLIASAKDHGVSVLDSLVRAAVRGYRGQGSLLDSGGVKALAEAIAAVNSTAELLGRSRVLEMADRVRSSGGSLASFADEPLSSVPMGSVLASPEDAVNYFAGLYPSLGLDPGRFAGRQRRRAFTLAASANQSLTASVQSAVAKSLRDNEDTATAAGRIADLLDASGATTRNPQYAQMVFRTNAADAFQTGLWEQGVHEDFASVFPAWEYLGVRDGRQGSDHEPNFGKFFPRLARFADVRGPRPYNCRCSLRWVDSHEWADLEASGHQLSRGG